MHTKSIIIKVIFIFNIIAAIALLLCYAAPYINPAQYWAIAFFGLAYPFIVSINFAFVVFWVIVFNKKFILSLIIILLGYNHIVHYVKFNAKSIQKTQNMINVVQFNTHFMGAYDNKNKDTLMFFKTLNNIDPDIICFQEFANMMGNFEKPMFKKFLEDYKNFAVVNADTLGVTSAIGYGVCIFSKHPIVNYGFLERLNKTANLSLYADIKFNNKIIRVVNTHLRSISFKQNDYRTVESIKQNNANLGGIRNMVAKLKYAFVRRARQADLLRKKLNESPYPLIICGDFNDAPTSYAYKTVKGDLKDAFNQSGKGLSRTYIGKMPSYRIDYILHDKSFKSYNYKATSLNFSDHKMISATIDVNY